MFFDFSAALLLLFK